MDVTFLGTGCCLDAPLLFFTKFSELDLHPILDDILKNLIIICQKTVYIFYHLLYNISEEHWRCVMGFMDFDLLVSSFQKRYPDKDFYDLVLRYVVQRHQSVSTSNYGSIDPEQYRELHKIVYRQSERHPETSPWIVADAVVSCCVKYGVVEFLQNYTTGGIWFDAELKSCCI